MRKTRFLIWGAPLSGNLGGQTIMAGITACIKEHFPNFTLLLRPQGKEVNPDVASAFCRRYGIVEGQGIRLQVLVMAVLWGIVNRASQRMGFGPLVQEKVRNQVVREILMSDCVMDARGISQTDFFGGWRAHVLENLFLFTGYLLGKPTVKFTQDMGPFLSLSNRFTARYFLRKYTHIFARGIITQELLREIDVSDNVSVSPDTGFLLDPIMPLPSDVQGFLNAAREASAPVLAVVASRQVDSRSRLPGEGEGESKYFRCLSDFVTKIVLEGRCRLLLLPNEFSRGYDDLFLAKKLAARLPAELYYCLEHALEAEAFRSCMAACDAAIASRYHSVVAALAACTPVLCIGWGYKYDQLMQLSGHGRYLLNHEKMTKEALSAMFDELWQRQAQLHARLLDMIPEIRDTVLKNAGILKSCVDPASPSREGTDE